MNLGAHPFRFHRVTRRHVIESILASALLAVTITASARGDNWLRFRGPNGSGTSRDAAATPTTWTASDNVVWKADLPGPGLSSPIVVGEKVFVTCWTGYGTGDDAQPPETLRRHLLCIDRATGNTLWSREVEPTLPEDPFEGMFAENGYASHSPVSDGERVYVFFGKTGALAFDMEGNRLWHTPLGTESDPRGWGSAASPILFDNLLIVTASAESEALVALDKLTGEIVWRKEAAGFSGTWGTPVLVRVDETRTDLVLAVPGEIWAFDPATGKLRWYCEAPTPNSVCASVVTHDGIVYAIGGRDGGSLAVRGGGEGDVTSTHVLWTGRDRVGIGTPLYDDGRIHWLSSGVAHCIDAANGERLYQSRLTETGGETSSEAPTRPRRGGGGFGGARGQDYSSPVAADGKLYFVSRTGTATVLALGPEFRQLASNTFAEGGEQFSATPAVSDGQLFIRSNRRLYCIADRSE